MKDSIRYIVFRRITNGFSNVEEIMEYPLLTKVGNVSRSQCSVLYDLNKQYSDSNKYRIEIMFINKDGS
ncbi:MAG: hypothetical protein ACXADH_11140 [Candidatus Kariarchaeaceae archaeon]|jgi:hypothetical protein